MSRSASLPMYDLPEVAEATDRLWGAIAGRLRSAGVAGVPLALRRDAGHHLLWADPDLLFGQACGFPYTHAFAGRLQLVATPCYRAPGCEGPLYRSLLVVRCESDAAALADLRGAVAAVNAWDSQSGWNCLAAAVAPLTPHGRFFQAARLTGSHTASIAAVAAGEADIAAIDCVTHALLARYRPEALAGVRTLGFSPAAPGLPYVTAAATSPAVLDLVRQALGDAMADPGLAATREALLLDGVAELDDAAYAAIIRMAGHGFPRPPA